MIYIPAWVPHQEINASPSEPLECVLVHSDNEAVVVNLDIEPVEKPETVLWVDPIAGNRQSCKAGTFTMRSVRAEEAWP